MPISSIITNSIADANVTSAKIESTLSNKIFVNPTISDLAFTAGSASAPSFFPTGDTNTGLFFPAADTVAITTGGSERVTFGTNSITFIPAVNFPSSGIWNSSGNVGIGTTSPGSKLHVYGATQLYAGTAGSSPALIFGDETGVSKKSIFLENYWMVYQGHDNEGHKFRSINSAGASTDDMVITGAGNVGIGTATPGGLLDVGSSSQFRIDSSGDVTKIKGVAYSWPSSQGAASTVLTNNGSGTLTWTTVSGGGGSSQWTTSGSNIYYNSGNVGIGTTSPGGRLSVQSANSDGALTNSVFVFNDGSGSGTGARLCLGVRAEENRSAGISGFYDGTGTTLGFYTVGTYTSGSQAERMRITNSGNVGIGTANPAATLHVDAAGGGIIQVSRIGAGGGIIQLEADGTNGTLTTTNIMRFQTASAERMRIDASGNVGIGTASPSQKFDVSVATTTQGEGLGITNSQAGGYGSGITFYSFRSNGSTKQAAAQIKVEGSSAWNSDAAVDSHMHFITVNDNVLSTKMFISTSGNVGIGTTNPVGKLDVSGGNYDTGIIIRSASSAGAGLTIKNTDTGGNEWNLISTGSGNSGGAGNIAFYNTTQGTYRFYITSGGNVGIGTASPAAKLDVVGTAQISSNLTLSGGTASGILYLNGSKVATSGSALVFDGTNLGVGTSSPDALLTVNTIASFGAGAAATPSIAAKGDLNTGIYFPAADTLAASTGGGERMRINSSGNVGIGTTSPGAKLTVSDGETVGSASLAVASNSTTNNVAYFYSNASMAGNVLRVYQDGAGSTGAALYVYTDASNAAIFEKGNVGIGTSSPGGLLDVGSSSQFRVDSSGDVTKIRNVAYSWPSSQGAASTVLTNNGSGTLTWSTVSSSQWTTSGSDIYYNSGSVGIGTSTPSTKLDVAGTIRARNSGSTGYFYRGYRNSTTSAYFVYDDATNIHFGVEPTDIPLLFNTSNTERMRITPAGLVGIGTSTPDAVLTVNSIASFGAGSASTPSIAAKGDLNTGFYFAAADKVNFAEGGTGYRVGFRNIPPVGTFSGSTNYTLTVEDVGKYIRLTDSATITIPNNVFSEGDVVRVFNDSYNSKTITCSISTAYMSGNNTDFSTIGLSVRGFATIFFISGTVCVLQGSIYDTTPPPGDGWQP